MKLGTCIVAVHFAGILASPVLDTRKLPEGIKFAQHGHMNYHLDRHSRSRHELDLRALAAGGPSDNSSPVVQSVPAKVEKPSMGNGDSPAANRKDDIAPSTPPSQNPPSLEDVVKEPIIDNDDKDTPAEDVIDYLDKVYGAAHGEGPSDDWHDQGENDQPSHVAIPPPVVHVRPSTPPAHPKPAPPKKEIVVYETEVVVVTAVVNPANGQPKAMPQTSSSSPPAASPASPNVANNQDDAIANNKPTKPQNHPVKQTKPKEVAKPQKKPAPKVEVPKPQPKKIDLSPPVQNQAQSPPPVQEKPQPEKTQPKPQPTVKEPAGKPASGANINTDGLPMEFVDDLDCNSDIYKGLSKLHHDIHRTNHSLSPLAWNDTLFEYAKETAESCIYGHSLAPGGGGYGQNIASGDAPGNISAVLTNAFYNLEIMLFFEAIGRQWGSNDPDMSDFEHWGHATQMLWKDTTSFACYTATCSPPGADPLDCAPDGTSYLKNVGCGNGGTQAYNTVCNYYPPGNYPNEYASVPAPDGSVGFVEMTHNGVIGL